MAQGESREDKVLNLAADVLKYVPEPIDFETTAKMIADDMTPLNVVLLQEVRMYATTCYLSRNTYHILRNYVASIPGR